MRWYWIDRFVEFESGRRAVALKNVAMAEEQVELYTPGRPMMPCSLIIEGFAQAGGLLVGENDGFKERVVLAKVSKAVFHDYARPGDVMRYTTVLDDINEQGAFVNATSYIDDVLQAEAQLMFAKVPDLPGIPDEMFEPCDFLCMIRSFGMYDVGRDKEGNPLIPPQHLLEAEKENLSQFDPEKIQDQIRA